jgi:hypothetical protein
MPLLAIVLIDESRQKNQYYSRIAATNNLQKLMLVA